MRWRDRGDAAHSLRFCFSSCLNSPFSLLPPFPSSSPTSTRAPAPTGPPSPPTWPPPGASTTTTSQRWPSSAACCGRATLPTTRGRPTRTGTFTSGRGRRTRTCCSWRERGWGPGGPPLVRGRRSWPFVDSTAGRLRTRSCRGPRLTRSGLRPAPGPRSFLNRDRDPSRVCHERCAQHAALWLIAAAAAFISTAAASSASAT